MSHIHFRDPGRRRFLGLAALTAAALDLGMFGRAAHAAATALPKPRQIDVGPLSVGYVEMGPADGTVVLPLHGWPYDIYSRLIYTSDAAEE